MDADTAFSGFKQWFDEAGRHVLMRQPLTTSQDRSLVMDIGDIIHFGPKTVEGGVVTPKYGVIKGIKGNQVTVLRFNDAQLVVIPKNQLYEVPYSVINGRFPSGNAPPVADELEGYYQKGIIKRQKVWMKLSPKQLKRYEKFIKTHDTSTSKMDPAALMQYVGSEEDIGFDEPSDIGFDEPSEPTPTLDAPKTATLFGQEIPRPPEIKYSSLADRVKNLKKKGDPVAPGGPLTLSQIIDKRREKKTASVGEWVALKY